MIVASFVLVLTIPTQAQNFPPQVSNVAAVVDTPVNAVTITYDLADAEQDTMEIWLRVSSDSGQTYLVPVDSVTGDVGYPVTPGAQKQILWHYDPDSLVLDRNTGRFQAKVVADDLFEIDIKNVVDQVDSLNLKNNLTFIQGIRHRTTGPSHLQDVQDSIAAHFLSHGLQVSVDEFAYGAYTAKNIIGRLPGQTPEANTYYITGHYDTVFDSPGADDNGAAIAGIFEAVRIFSQYHFNHTIKFAGFDLEEEGKIGSVNYVSQAIPSYEQINGVFNLEMIGYFCDQPNCQTLPSDFQTLFPAFYDSVAAHNFRGDFIFNIANVASNPIRFALDSCAAAFVPGLRVLSLAVPDNGHLVPDLRRSDHASFWDAGYQALMLVDGGNFRNPHYHTPSDTVGTLDFEFMTDVVKATVAAVAKLSEIQHSGVGISQPFDIGTTAIAVQSDQTPQQFSLAQNYPNPFNPNTVIRYGLPHAAKVRLEVYNLVGQHVAILVDEQKPAGYHEVRFDGRELSSGMYFYRIQTAGFSATKKMLMMK
ncbi:MAG: M28 family peptidase [Aliifodinibius sp.]|nr:M28 family peptidase [Fodinibius sp.]NIY23262.1 M28 family peptidase [Fodinibius sp.]